MNSCAMLPTQAAACIRRTPRGSDQPAASTYGSWETTTIRLIRRLPSPRYSWQAPSTYWSLRSYFRLAESIGRFERCFYCISSTGASKASFTADASFCERALVLPARFLLRRRSGMSRHPSYGRPTVSKKFLTEPICMFGVNGVSRRVRDAGYRSLRLALAHRTLGCGAFLALRVLAMIEPLIKHLVKIR